MGVFVNIMLNFLILCLLFDLVSLFLGINFKRNGNNFIIIYRKRFIDKIFIKDLYKIMKK